jgi:cytochrome oxidase Cu insertion factor (SCO1/SenC/PrrC family)/thiol-disulfide isomerase/thioredoxin
VKLSRARRIVNSALVLVLAAFAAVSVLASVRHGQATSVVGIPAPLAVGTELQRPPLVPRVELIDQEGKPFSLASWRGKWVVLAPSMTLCQEVCPMTSGVLSQLTGDLRRAGLSSRVVVAEVTVDPWRDTPARLRAYRRLTGVNFQMLTGSQAAIRKLWKFFGVYYHRVPEGRPAAIDWMTHKPETFDVEHTDAVFFIDPAGQERIVNEGMPDVGGRLSVVLRRMLDAQGLYNLAHPELPWTAAEALDDIDYLMNRNIPARAVPVATPPSPAATRASLAGSPDALAKLHRQASQLLGPESALAARINALRGYPIVINIWAQWCPACRSEFPLFAQASARYGRRVAFLGVDTNDSAADGRSFLAQHQVSYPSYQSSSTQLESLAVVQGMPMTIYLNRAGEVIWRHIAEYQSLGSLENDIEHYALGVHG